jgi:hypothetical protein
MSPPEIPPAVAIVGKKNSGKTTLVVALAARLKRAGYRVATIKHGHHAFESDEPGRDSWRHFNQGEAEASIMCGSGKVGAHHAHRRRARPRAAHPRASTRGAATTWCWWKASSTGRFPGFEIFRRGVHAHPVHEPGSPEVLAFVTDDLDWRCAPASAGSVVIPLDHAGTHVDALVRLIERSVIGRHAR